MTPEPPSVSIIIPVYNRASLLKRAIVSALQDAEVRTEVVVVDDGSTDESAEIARSMGPPVRVFRQQNAGPSTARNHGFAESVGTYVRFLDSDDWLLPGANAAQVAQLERSGADVCYGDWRSAFRDENSEQSAGRPLLSMGPVGDPVEALLGDRWAPNFGYLMRRELVDAVGGWDEDRALTGIEDFDFILRVALNGGRFIHLDRDVGRYYHHPGPRTSTSSLLGWCNAKKAILETGIRFLEGESAWTDGRRQATARTLLRLAKQYYGLDRTQFRACLARIADIAPQFQPPGRLYRTMVGILGYAGTEAILEVRRRLWTGTNHQRLGE